MMISLLINDVVASQEPATRFGGRPLHPENTPLTWPVCADCGNPQQFQFQLVISEEGVSRLLSVFMCDGPDGCSTWEPNGRCNTVFVYPITSESVFVLAESQAEPRANEHGARLESVDAPDYDQARSGWSEAHEGQQRQVLGQLFGAPDWLQGEEVPTCEQCGQEMRFVAQLEEGPDYRSSMNFGGGCAYLFDCACGIAKFLWQQ